MRASTGDRRPAACSRSGRSVCDERVHARSSGTIVLPCVRGIRSLISAITMRAECDRGQRRVDRRAERAVAVRDRAARAARARRRAGSRLTMNSAGMSDRNTGMKSARPRPRRSRIPHRRRARPSAAAPRRSGATKRRAPVRVQVIEPHALEIRPRGAAPRAAASASPPRRGRTRAAPNGLSQPLLRGRFTARATRTHPDSYAAASCPTRLREARLDRAPNAAPHCTGSLTWGRTGFDEDVDARIARRGAHGHVKMGKPATANDNAVALAA